MNDLHFDLDGVQSYDLRIDLGTSFVQTGYYLACLDLGVNPKYNVAERERVRHYKI